MTTGIQRLKRGDGCLEKSERWLLGVTSEVDPQGRGGYEAEGGPGEAQSEGAPGIWGAPGSPELL